MKKPPTPKLLKYDDGAVRLTTPDRAVVLLRPLYEVCTTTGHFIGQISYRTVGKENQQVFTAIPAGHQQYARDHETLDKALSWLFERIGVSCNFTAIAPDEKIGADGVLLQ